MRDYFFSCVDYLTNTLRANEVLLVNYSGEESDFVRLNGSRVRQAGSVVQHYVSLQLVDGARHACAETTVSGVAEADRPMLTGLLENLRARLPQLPEDPHLLYATEVHPTERIEPNRLPETDQAVGAILDAGSGRDLVGIYASGTILRGFANSLGQRNWFETASFHFDWSLHAHGDKAVKGAYAGFEWHANLLDHRIAAAEAELQIARREARTIEPGEYRTYLAPSALKEIVRLLGWGGFSIRAHRTGTTPLLRLVRGEAELNAGVTISENTRGGIAPGFSEAGFVKPDSVALVEKGQHGRPLVSPRSAREYGVPTTGGDEYPESLDVGAGDLSTADILNTLGTGLYINTLWYLNYSDRSAGRITGMTRFATFWVENGAIVSPVNVMRFDETVYRMLGGELTGLTREREFFPSSHTYFARHIDSIRVPGALVNRLRLTL